MHEAVMTIGGAPIRVTRMFGVINPATGKVFAEAHDCSKSELDDAMDAAERAFHTWRSDEKARREGLQRAAEATQLHMLRSCDDLSAWSPRSRPGTFLCSWQPGRSVLPWSRGIQ
jgi:delta 1-pyrroline-5-carboxylate dehydrogenase